MKVVKTRVWSNQLWFFPPCPGKASYSGQRWPEWLRRCVNSSPTFLSSFPGCPRPRRIQQTSLQSFSPWKSSSCQLQGSRPKPENWLWWWLLLTKHLISSLLRGLGFANFPASGVNATLAESNSQLPSPLKAFVKVWRHCTDFLNYTRCLNSTINLSGRINK